MQEKSIPLNYGLSLGIALIFMLIVVYFIDIKIIVDYGFVCTLTCLVTTVLFGILSIVKIKKELAGAILFGRAFSAFMITVFLGNIINLLFTYCLFNFIDEKSALIVKDKVYKNAVLEMEGIHKLPEYVKRKKLSTILETDFFGILELLISTGFLLLVTAFLGMIISFCLKKTNKSYV